MTKIKNELKETQLRKEIYQTNPLINARKGMGIMELRIFSIGLSGINPHISKKDKYFDEDFKEMFITPKKLVELFGNPKYLNELKKVCKNLFNTTITLDIEEDGWELCHVFQKITYKPKKGLFLRFDDTMKPYILNLFEAGGYTRITLSQLFYLSSAYAWRIVELMLQFQGTKKRIITRKFKVDELRFLLNVPENSYKTMTNFKKNVLDNPIDEINNKTDYVVTYESVKDKNKIVAFTISMDTYKVRKLEKDKILDLNIIRNQNTTESIKKLKEIGFTDQTAKKIYEVCKDEKDCLNRIKYALEQVKKYENRGEVVNKPAFIRKAIEENWYQREIDNQNQSIIAAWNSESELYFDDDFEYSGEEKELSDRDIVFLKSYLKKGYWTETNKNVLRSHNLKVRRFIDLYVV